MNTRLPTYSRQSSWVKSLWTGAALLASASVSAEQPVYLFADIGMNRLDIKFVDEATAGFSAGFGYEFNSYVAVEAAYNDFGEADRRAVNTVFGEYDLESVSLSLHVGNEAGTNKYLFGIFGLERFEDDISVTTNDSPIDESAIDVDYPSETEVIYGVGLYLSTDSPTPARLTLTSRAGEKVLRLTAGVRIF